MRRFRLSGRSGVYLGVLRPGIVRPGDRFVRSGGEAGAPSVARLSALCDSGTPVSPADRVVIERALASPHLSPTVRSTLTLKLANLDRDGASDPSAWTGWRRFDVSELTEEQGDAISVRLVPADGGPLPRFDAGQHVVVRLTRRDRPPIVRTWSLSEWQRDPSSYRITVKRRPGGLGGAALARAVSEHVEIDLRAPAGRFRLDRGSFRPVVLVAAGVGITPLMAMVRAHLDRDLHTPPLWLLHGSADAASAVFGRELEELFSGSDDLRLHAFHSRGGPTTAASSGDVHSGRITAARVVDVMRGNYLRTPDGPASIPWFESDVYICGSAEFAETVRAGLVDAGANPDHVNVEDFAAAADVQAGPSRTSDASVTFGNGLAATWRAAKERTLLELGEDNGVDLPFDCRTGSCRTCEALIVSGEVDGAHRTAPDGTVRALLCSSFPLSDRLVIGATED
jgi:ferredoxin-NADP reductase